MEFRKFESDKDVTEFVLNNTEIFEPDTQLTVSEIGDGNINFIYRVAQSGGESVIVKQALPYVRIIGEGWPLSQDRVRIEAETLQYEGSLCPDLVPAVYHFDADLCAIVMEDIGQHENLRHALIARRRLPNLASDLGRFLADTLFHSSDLYLDSQAKKDLVKSFINPDLCKITEELFFWDPYCDHERNSINPHLRPYAEQLWADDALKLEVYKLKRQFLCDAEALLHGDLHAGSVFASGSGTKVIDPEFAYVGPIGFDVGSILGNYLLNYAGQANLPGDLAERRDYQAWLLDSIETLWDTFAERFYIHMREKTQDPSFDNETYRVWYLDKLFADTLGYAGTEMIRRTIGLAHVADIDSIEDLQSRANSEKLALRIGCELIMARDQITDVEALAQRIRRIS